MRLVTADHRWLPKSSGSPPVAGVRARGRAVEAALLIGRCPARRLHGGGMVPAAPPRAGGRSVPAAHRPRGSGCRPVARPVLAVAVGLSGGQLGRVAGAEVGPVAAEDGDPLRPGLGHVGRDEVRGVGQPSAGHADVGRGGAGLVTDHHVRGGNGVTLHAVRGAGVGQLHVLGDVAGGQHPDRCAGRGDIAPGDVTGGRAAVTSSPPRRPTAVTVHVSRLATSRSRSLRRVAIRSPAPIR